MGGVLRGRVSASPHIPPTFVLNMRDLRTVQTYRADMRVPVGSLYFFSLLSGHYSGASTNVRGGFEDAQCMCSNR